MKRKLPVLVDQAVGAVQAEAAEKGVAFERLVRTKKQPSCRVGCDHCCYHPVEVSLFEAIPIYRFLVARGRWTPSFVRALEEHDAKVAHLTMTIWLFTKIPCPLLADHKCSAYEVRPFQCRTTWAVGDPHYCKGEEFGSQTGLIPRAELAQTFRDYERLFAQPLNHTYLTMPLSRALLLAAKVVTGEVSVSDTHLVLFENFQRNG